MENGRVLVVVYAPSREELEGALLYFRRRWGAVQGSVASSAGRFGWKVSLSVPWVLACEVKEGVH